MRFDVGPRQPAFPRFHRCAHRAWPRLHRTRTRRATQPVAIVNQEFVKRFYPKEDPIGKHFGIDLPQYSGAFEIVGVFHDFKMNNPRE